MASPESFGSIWRVLDARVASGRFPGYVAAVRLGRDTEIHAAGTMAIDAASPPMTEDTLFRIASITKPMGGALTLSLAQDGGLALDDPIAQWLPEAANPRVLVTRDAPLDHTTTAERAVTVRHLLTCTSGWGIGLEDTPLHRAMMERGVFPSALPLDLSADEFVARVTDLPLAFQPGEGWSYDTSFNLLGVVLERATGTSLSDLFAERITGPLGMTSTSFSSNDTTRMATLYRAGHDGLEELDPPDGAYARPPRFEQLSGGIVSSARDVLRFFTAMADGGDPVLRAESVALMTADALTGAQREQARPFLNRGGSWGLGTAVDTEAEEPWMASGRWGWTGGTGTTASVDPVREVVSVLLTQRAMAGPLDGFEYFWLAVADAASDRARS